MNDPQPNPDALAQACVDALFSRDQASQALGIELLDAGAGRARLRMAVRADMLQGHGTCHGGFLFALADSAFAFACNSYDQATVALGCSIDYVAPALRGDVLTAVSYTHLTLPTIAAECRSRWSPYH